MEYESFFSLTEHEILRRQYSCTSFPKIYNFHVSKNLGLFIRMLKKYQKT